MRVVNNTFGDNLAQLGYRNELKLPLKSNVAEHLLLYFFVPKRKYIKLFVALQPFEKHECFVLKLCITNGLEMVV